MDRLIWRTADDPLPVHALVESSDRAAARRSGTPPPRRRHASTRFLVARGLVRLGTEDGVPVVTVTVGPLPSFDSSSLDPAEGALPGAERPWYMQRLAVTPAHPDPLLGVRAVRHAMSLAAGAGADALRAEANPDLSDVLEMLCSLGFARYGTIDTGPLRRTFLHLPLRGRP
ncbi:hypothetical protein [Streptomyces sp. UNOC14_S4]|uniref:hypothetical protein n=1 Tax=Streptomyces sp. UNOC14_S4 TaxID=2872340 RepID=UPI001E2FCFD9|nr:hypothetical protein [Streptomyces sp. UNOC14_S4]MCC3769510.1 hypothetical protein [Streptomyces sp. UNOC14_S4]